jgi:HD-GYP domain-containing protein (c-di-GMP phosphodiesterase class II)
MKMYDMSSSIAGAHEKLDDYGYITFDLNKKLMNDNYVARKYFPELYEVEIDENAKKDESVFYREIVEWMDLKKNEESKEKKVVIKDRIIKCTVRRIYQGYKKKVIGYSIELVDITKEENYIRLLNDYGANLAKEVEKKTEHIRNMQNSIITGMATMVESRDNSTGGHIMRTSECVRVFAGALKWKMPELTVHFLKDVVKAAPMHDLGKIAVDDRILRKPGSFTDEEYEIMKSHSAEGARIVGEVLAEVQDEQFKQIAINVAHYHHEKWDGSGYPEGKKGNEIPVEARIMAFADVFDTLVSKRYYKEAYSYEKAFSIIEESLGTHFDPELGKVFLECREELEKLYDEIAE